ncbi:MAG: peptidylprolyl isomerase [Planctomycetota bacterium]
MSQQTPPQEGQITTPNPLELLWEKNKKQIIGVILVIVVVLIGKNLWEYAERMKRNETWGSFAEKTGLRETWAPAALDITIPDFFRQYEQQNPGIVARVIGQSLLMHWQSVKSKMFSALRELDTAGLDELQERYAGQPAAYWAQWVEACKLAADGRVDDARQAVDALRKAGAPLPVLGETEYPPVYVAKVDAAAKVASGDGAEKTEDGGKAGKDEGLAGQDGPLRAARTSVAAAMLAAAERNKAFREAHPELFVAPEAAGKTVVFDTTEGPIEVRLYSGRVPATCAHFLKNVEEKVYDGLHFDRIERAGTNQDADGVAQLVHFGNPSTKDEDRSKWTEYKSEETLPFESGSPSHFPYVLAAFRQADRRDNDTRLVYFTANDCAESRDEEYVVFGVVVNEAGKQVLERAVRAPLENTQDEDVGRGRPREPILVRGVTVKGE